MINIEKANTLIEALPYIEKHQGKTIVVKYGGSAIEKRWSKGICYGRPCVNELCWNQYSFSTWWRGRNQ